jgi:RHS repeat-associated protein
LVSKKTDGVVTRFYWDGDALLGDVTGDDTREWVYYPGSFEPLAMARNEEFYLYHNEPNGCPTLLLDESGNVVWAARYDAWGKVKKLLVDEVEHPLRLQGQYFDREMGLYYNRFRYYCAEIGAFVNQDPLGLNAGENVYGFGPNTQTWVDPLGLCKSQTSKNTLHTISKDKSVIVVGESMSRVNKVADELKSLGYNVKTYNPRKFRSFTPDNPGVNPLDMEANRSWLKYWTKEKNATVVDIGLDNARTLPRSPFYQMESRSLYSNWNYNNVIKYDPGF